MTSRFGAGPWEYPQGIHAAAAAKRMSDDGKSRPIIFEQCANNGRIGGNIQNADRCQAVPGRIVRQHAIPGFEQFRHKIPPAARVGGPAVTQQYQRRNSSSPVVFNDVLPGHLAVYLAGGIQKLPFFFTDRWFWRFK